MVQTYTMVHSRLKNLTVKCSLENIPKLKPRGWFYFDFQEENNSFFINSMFLKDFDFDCILEQSLKQYSNCSTLIFCIRNWKDFNWKMVFQSLLSENSPFPQSVFYTIQKYLLDQNLPIVSGELLREWLFKLIS